MDFTAVKHIWFQEPQLGYIMQGLATVILLCQYKETFMGALECEDVRQQPVR